MHGCCIRVTVLLEYLEWASDNLYMMEVQGVQFSILPLFMHRATQNAGSTVLVEKFVIYNYDFIASKGMSLNW